MCAQGAREPGCGEPSIGGLCHPCDHFHVRDKVGALCECHSIGDIGLGPTVTGSWPGEEEEAKCLVGVRLGSMGLAGAEVFS